jgi:tetratricopeptide (TPR) repeat protein
MKKILILGAALLLTACSSAPKRSMQVSTIYSTAYEMIESANACILSGDYDKAGFFLSAAENQAMSIDNYDLLTDASLARCSLSLSVNPPDIETAERYVGFAQGFVKNCINPKKQQALVALNEVRIETAKGNLDENANVNISALLNKLEENKKDVKGDPYYEAQFTLAQGDVYKLKKDYVQADKSYTAAAKEFTDNRYLSEIGISWYKAAQARSLAGNKDSAIQAMEQAIFYDRAAENSLALGTDYYAVGLILVKGSPTSGEKERAVEAFTHSAEIFTAIDADELAKRSRTAAAEVK